MTTNKMRRRLFWLFGISFLLIVFNGVLNFTVRDVPFMGIVCVGTSVGILLSCFAFLHNRDIKLAYFRAILIISIQILAAASRSDLRLTTLLWIFPLPLIAFYTQGLRTGLIYSASFFVLYNAVKAFSLIFIYKTITYTPIYLETMVIFVIIILLTYNYQIALQQKEKKIHFQLYYDELTGLPKRKMLIHDLNKHISQTLFLINIDGFGRINSLIGVSGGDYVLLETTKRLRNLSNDYPKYTFYKLSSDEFAILIPKTLTPYKINSLVEQVNSIIKKEIIIDKTSIIIKVSIGISSALDKILTTADIALKYAKKQKKSYVIYNNSFNTPQLHKENLTRLYKLQIAIENDMIVPFFQPIYCNKTNTVYKYECLIRMKDENVIIGPSEFLELSIEARIYPLLTRIMISKSFQFFSGKDIRFSINISLDDILDSSTTDYIFSELEKYDIGSQVTFEFLESEKFEQFPEVLDFIEKIRLYNCSIAIDDFGTGYSNFDLLLRFKVDYIKLDGSIIKRIIDDKKTQILIETLVDFAGKIGAKVIAEYVKDKEISEVVSLYGIDYSQGYYFGKPQDNIL